jgi:hypothetical protein
MKTLVNGTGTLVLNTKSSHISIVEGEEVGIVFQGFTIVGAGDPKHRLLGKIRQALTALKFIFS